MGAAQYSAVRSAARSRRLWSPPRCDFINGKLAAPVTLLAGWAMKAQIEKWVHGEETVDSQGQQLRRLYFNSSYRTASCVNRERSPNVSMLIVAAFAAWRPP